MLTTHNPTKIAALKDAARKSFSGCHLYITPSVQAQLMVAATKKN
jgi:non-canonical (house-cleaning) NTP pyrophosphatase